MARGIAHDAARSARWCRRRILTKRKNRSTIRHDETTDSNESGSWNLHRMDYRDCRLCFGRSVVPESCPEHSRESVGTVIEPHRVVRAEARRFGKRNKLLQGVIVLCDICRLEVWIQKSAMSRLHGRCQICKSIPFRKRPYESLYNSFVKSNEGRKSINLSFEEFVTFTYIKNCHYCGGEVQWTEFCTQRLGNRYNLDCKDSKAGYNKDNVVVCCKLCNKTKMDNFSYEEFLEIGKVIGRIRHTNEYQ